MRVTIAELTLDLPALANALDAYLMDPALGVNVRANELVFLQLQWAWVRQSRTLLAACGESRVLKGHGFSRAVSAAESAGL